MTLRYFPILFTGLGFCLAGALLAANSLEEKYHAFDTNKDGLIAGEEINAAPVLKQLDLNGDGTLTKQEAVEGVKRLKSGASAEAKTGKKATRTDAAFGYLDKDRNGSLTAIELANNDLFEKLDVNKDGGITLAEALKVLGEFLPEGAKHPAATAEAGVKEDPTLKEQPQLLKPSEYGVGHLISDLNLKDAQGKKVKLSAVAGAKPLLIALFSSTCPMSKKFGPELARLEKEYAAKGFSIILLNTASDDKAEDVRGFTEAFQIVSPVLSDADGEALRALHATTTTETFLLDAARTLVYRGAINDQYGLGYSKDKPTRTYLRDALEATLRQEPPMVTATTAPGCALDVKKPDATTMNNQVTDKTSQPTQAVTYHREVSRIMQTNCVECHRKDGVAPFSLETKADLVENAGMIRKQVERGAMPPWFAAPQQGATGHIWSNDRSLTDKDKRDLLAWLDSDRAEGDAKEAPLPRKFWDLWTIGQPDVVLQIPQPIAIKAEGTMPYQHAIVTTNFAEDRWVQSYEIMPTARAVVHHVIVRVHPKGQRVTDRDEGGDGFWAAYVPGNASRVLGDGFAKKLPAGATLSFQIHYTPNGTATSDQIKIGLKFADKPPRYEVHVVAVAQHKFAIPAGAANHVVVAKQRAPLDMMFTAFMAHMHVRGKAFKYEITYPDGKNETLLDIPRYDFNWQLQYNYAQPKFIPRGSEMTATAVFDNSADNPANPDPTKIVRWGAQTYDEMMIGYIEHYTPLSPADLAAK